VGIKTGTGTIISMPLERLKNISTISYGITVHKCQGKTITGKIVINPTRLFAKNHLYVALTRATCLNNIYLTTPIQNRGEEDNYDEPDLCDLGY
jgi:ATP-dependent exoDNAse (exonuclease V) alpha subunit